MADQGSWVNLYPLQGVQIDPAQAFRDGRHTCERSPPRSGPADRLMVWGAVEIYGTAMTIDAISDAEAASQIGGENFRMYYSLQYTRIAQHENGRLQVSSFVVAASVVALGLLALPKDGLSRVFVAAPIAVAVVNVLAILYARQSRKWVKFHQRRARVALAALAPELAKLQDGADAPAKPDSGRDPFRSQLLITYLPGVIAVTALLLIIGW